MTVVYISFFFLCFVRQYLIPVVPNKNTHLHHYGNIFPPAVLPKYAMFTFSSQPNKNNKQITNNAEKTSTDYDKFEIV